MMKSNLVLDTAGKKLHRMEATKEHGAKDRETATYHIYANHIYSSAELSSNVNKLLF